MNEFNAFPSGKVIRKEVASAWSRNTAALKQADEILDHARAEAEALVREAHFRAQEQIEQEVAQRVAEAMAEIAADYRQALSQIEEDVVNVTQQCLLRIMAELPPVDVLQGIFQRAINEQDRNEDSLQVMVSPEHILDAETALSQCYFGDDVTIKCVADETLGNDTFLIANRFGVVDVSPLKQIDALYTAMRKGLSA